MGSHMPCSFFTQLEPCVSRRTTPDIYARSAYCSWRCTWRIEERWNFPLALSSLLLSQFLPLWAGGSGHETDSQLHSVGHCVFLRRRFGSHNNMRRDETAREEWFQLSAVH